MGVGGGGEGLFCIRQLRRGFLEPRPRSIPTGVQRERLDPVREHLDPRAEHLDPLPEHLDPVPEHLDPLAEHLDPLQEPKKPILFSGLKKPKKPNGLAKNVLRKTSRNYLLTD